MGRRLERHVDWDLTDRILASGPIKKAAPSTKVRKTPRLAATYRQNGAPIKSLVKDRSFKGRIRLNTTRKRPSQYAA